MYWTPPRDSAREQKLAARLRRASRFYRFLWEIRRELFEHISDMVHWAHARGNLGQPLARPSGYPDDYFTHNPAAWHKAQESL